MKNILNVIPLPNKVMPSEGSFVFCPDMKVSYGPKSLAAGSFLCNITGLGRDIEGSVLFEEDDSIENPEAYRLQIEPCRIIVFACGSAGFFYGAQTLRQLLPPSLETGHKVEGAVVPCLVIEDFPRFPHRGFMLDSARHFFGIATIERLLDLMALHKLNRFHWHLSDDQGFRMEVGKRPLLTKTGSCRLQSQTGGGLLFGRKRFDGTPYSGFYSKEQMQGIVAYAKERFIEVIPEIDMPGHTAAILAAYPGCGCTGGPYVTGWRWGIYKDILCPGKELSYSVAKDILDEVVSIFPYKYIHIGGDEVPMKRWRNCPDCRLVMKMNHMKDYRELQMLFMNRIISYLKEKDHLAICWDESAHTELDDGAVIQYWSPFGLKRTRESLQDGRKCIFSPFKKYYLDYSYELMPLRSTYEYEPRMQGLPEDENRLIIGVEAPLWTEYTASAEKLFWQAFPRLSAVSESAWTLSNNRSFASFLGRLPGFETRLRMLGAEPASKDCHKYDGRPKLMKSFISRTHPSIREYEKFRSST
ncbi:MAG: beta-N-acetylhexosaminidase [Clostridia bacterium]|nr:beta-N-acetylhexosaminidase [Clostridia bacterium]